MWALDGGGGDGFGGGGGGGGGGGDSDGGSGGGWRLLFGGGWCSGPCFGGGAFLEDVPTQAVTHLRPPCLQCGLAHPFLTPGKLAGAPQQREVVVSERRSLHRGGGDQGEVGEAMLTFALRGTPHSYRFRA